MNGELKLLPCPFCGGQPTLMCNSVVECRNCPTGKYSGYVSADISAWNTRPTHAPGALPELLRQVYGMAREGCDAPSAAYRWCERIDELFHAGKPSDEYADYAQDLPDATRAYADDEGVR